MRTIDGAGIRYPPRFASAGSPPETAAASAGSRDRFDLSQECISLRRMGLSVGYERLVSGRGSAAGHEPKLRECVPRAAGDDPDDYPAAGAGSSWRGSKPMRRRDRCVRPPAR
ncbi:hypothetical protein GCM10011588_07010 [Nocardia jinanensis]|uniref:Uncharacterized protein n=1 Tax=Nocardia jinanensis TaxID=382504 RepID=A0A917R8J0_9NOCA|nr:hypothetical protein GCM10011588_07010 [Nocardia jinanensis]